MPAGVRVTGYAEVAPDLVVEVVSPSDSRGSVHDKAQMWLRHGTSLVWVVRPNERTVDVYREDEPTITLREDDSLDGLNVLPGFACEVGAIFDA